MSVPLAPIPPIEAFASPAGPTSGLQIASKIGTEIPTADQEASFSREISMQTTDSEGTPPTAGIGDALLHQLDQLGRQMGTLQTGLTPPSSPGDPTAGAASAGLDRGEMETAIGQMQQAYAFAIETSMASRGSTESTKIFNTLLKGQ